MNPRRVVAWVLLLIVLAWLYALTVLMLYNLHVIDKDGHFL